MYVQLNVVDQLLAFPVEIDVDVRQSTWRKPGKSQQTKTSARRNLHWSEKGVSVFNSLSIFSTEDVLNYNSTALGPWYEKNNLQSTKRVDFAYDQRAKQDYDVRFCVLNVIALIC